MTYSIRQLSTATICLVLCQLEQKIFYDIIWYSIHKCNVCAVRARIWFNFKCLKCEFYVVWRDHILLLCYQLYAATFQLWSLLFFMAVFMHTTLVSYTIFVLFCFAFAAVCSLALCVWFHGNCFFFSIFFICFN